MSIDLSGISGMRVTVMGLGLHGGGVETARFFARRGARVTVTDLRDERSLQSSIDGLESLPIRFVLGRHSYEDFEQADLVVKNPAVRPDSPYLASARQVETDISVFLALVRPTLIAVTGTKGKSTTASAVHHVVANRYPDAQLGGNITVSPLSFIDTYLHGDPSRHGSIVVLELSSWQLADLRGKTAFVPRVGVVTNIMNDHQNRYHDMEAYRADKRVMVESQSESCYAVLNRDDPAVAAFAEHTKACPLFVSRRPPSPGNRGAWIETQGSDTVGYSNLHGVAETILRESRLPGLHSRMNLLTAGLCAHTLDMPADRIASALSSFTGIEHRLEAVATINGITYVNDSAATIPESTLRAVESYSGNVYLIAGGTDKELDFEAFAALRGRTAGISLLAGSATEKMVDVLELNRIPFAGPYDSLPDALRSATLAAKPGDVVLLSPGCASFEMFDNEFDRGRRFKSLVLAMADGKR